MTRRIQHARLTKAGTAPSKLVSGEISVNQPDGQLFLGLSDGTPSTVLSIRPWSATAQYVAGDIITRAGQLYRAKNTILPGAFVSASWDKLSPSGAWPADGAGYLKNDGAGGLSYSTPASGTSLPANSTGWLHNDGAGTLVWSSPTAYTLPAATTGALGGVQIGARLSVDGSGVVSADVQAGTYSLPTATGSVLGGVKVGTGLTITTGVLSADVQAGTYTLPTATGSVLGGVKSGSNITNTAGVLSLSAANVNAALGYTAANNSKLTGTFLNLMSGLSDVDHPASVSDGQYLAWSDADGKWIYFTNVTAFSGLDDVSLFSPAAGQILRYSGSAWSNVALTAGLSFVIPGVPTASLTFNLVLGFACTIPAGLTGTVVYDTTQATANSVWTLNKITAAGVLSAIGTVTITPTSHTSKTLAAASLTTFAAGDVLQLVGPATPDATLAGLGITILATRT